MTYTNPQHHTARFRKRPKGFAIHKATDDVPVTGGILIELLHTEPRGYAIGPRRTAELVHADEWASGSIVGWQLAPDRPPPTAPSALAEMLSKLPAESHPAPHGHPEAKSE